MSNIFFTSDLHYNHSNICKGTSKWKGSEGSSHSDQNTRDFKTLEEMNQAIIDNINKVVKHNDIMYCLGDWSFKSIDSIWELRRQLHCKNIHLILGNHDHHIENDKGIKLPKDINTRTKYVELTNNHGDFIGMGEDYITARIRPLFSSVSHYKKISIDKQEIIMSHYAMRVWDHSHHNSWMLYGHSHGTLPEYLASKTLEQAVSQEPNRYHRTMDVGIDTHPEFRPYHYDEIKLIMKDRVPLLIDHHNPNTN